MPKTCRSMASAWCSAASTPSWSSRRAQDSAKPAEPFSVASWKLDDDLALVQQAAAAAGGNVNAIPVHRCNVRPALAPPSAEKWRCGLERRLVLSRLRPDIAQSQLAFGANPLIITACAV